MRDLSLVIRFCGWAVFGHALDGRSARFIIRFRVPNAADFSTSTLRLAIGDFTIVPVHTWPSILPIRGAVLPSRRADFSGHARIVMR